MYYKCKVRFCVQTSLIMVSFIGSVLTRYVVDKYAIFKSRTNVVPWVGVLRHKPLEDVSEAITGIILIRNKTAIANAKEVSKINKMTITDTTKAMFLTPENEWWFSAVSNYTLHPEFNEETLNTLALLFLEYEEGAFRGEMLVWPEKAFTYSNVFAIGFTDQNRVLEQVVYRMDYINLTECKNFYVNEKLDTRWMRPTDYKCYRGMFNPKPCVYDAGMALAVNISSKWALLGMSTWGPGCALPARFITFSSFVPWIMSFFPKSKRRYGLDSSELREMKKNDFIYNVHQLDKNSVVLRPPGPFTEAVGECGSENTRDEYLMYHDEAKYFVPASAVGIYTFSYDNLKHSFNWNCILIRAGKEVHLKKTTKVWTTKRFGETFTESGRISDSIRIVPMKSINDIMEKKDKPQHLYLTDSWKNYENIDVRNIQIYFEFYKVGTFSIFFYSPLITQPINKTERQTFTTDRTFKRWPYKTDMYPMYTTTTMKMPEDSTYEPPIFHTTDEYPQTSDHTSYTSDHTSYTSDHTSYTYDHTSYTYDHTTLYTTDNSSIRKSFFAPKVVPYDDTSDTSEDDTSEDRSDDYIYFLDSYEQMNIN